jgi:hypothetical protein
MENLKMKIYIHSSGRPELSLQQTASCIPRSWLKHTRLVVQAAQEKSYQDTARSLGVALIALPKSIDRLSPTRQWILENAEENKFVLMDDDLRFFEARGPEFPGLYKDATDESFARMLSTISQTLDHYAHVGVAAREGANRLPLPGVELTRMMRVLAYDKKKALKSYARFDRVPTKQDFDMTLQMIRAGHKNYVLSQWCQNQRGSDVAGGCSVYRTAEMGDAVSHQLAALHPGYVSVVQKTTKKAWGGGTRTDVLIQWKRAFKGE